MKRGAWGPSRHPTRRARKRRSFNGTSISWIGYRGPEGGIGRVFLDGVFVTQIDTYAATDGLQDTVFTASGLAAGTHMLTIEATGQKNRPPTSRKTGGVASV